MGIKIWLGGSKEQALAGLAHQHGLLLGKYDVVESRGLLAAMAVIVVWILLQIMEQGGGRHVVGRAARAHVYFFFCRYKKNTVKKR